MDQITYDGILRDIVYRFFNEITDKVKLQLCAKSNAKLFLKNGYETIEPISYLIWKQIISRTTKK